METFGALLNLLVTHTEEDLAGEEGEGEDMAEVEEADDEEDDDDDDNDASDSGERLASFSFRPPKSSALLQDLRSQFVAICLKQFQRQPPAAQTILSKLLNGVAEKIRDRCETTSLMWLKQHLLLKCTEETNPYDLPMLPRSLVVGDEKYEEMSLQLDQVNGDADSVQSDLENKLAAIPLQRQQEEQAVEEWRKQRDALSQAEAEVERLQAEMSRLNATKEWLQQALSRAKKPEPRPQQGTPFSSPPPAGGSGACPAAPPLQGGPPGDGCR